MVGEKPSISKKKTDHTSELNAEFGWIGSAMAIRGEKSFRNSLHNLMGAGVPDFWTVLPSLKILFAKKL